MHYKFSVELKANRHNKAVHERIRGIADPLINIPLRSMLINAGRDTVKNSQPYRSGTSFKIASTGSRK